MVGIYKLTNKINGKVYIGQSKHIEKRLKEHVRKTYPGYHGPRNPITYALMKYGVENFDFSVVEECKFSELNEREIYYISLYKSNTKNGGYNMTAGADQQCVLRGELSPVAVAKREEVEFIRECYSDYNITKKQCYEQFNEKFHQINYSTFSDIWKGRCYKDIRPDVLTEENRIMNKKISTERREDVLEIRRLKKSGMKKGEVYKKFDQYNINTFKDVWCNNTFKDEQP